MDNIKSDLSNEMTSRLLANSETDNKGFSLCILDQNIEMFRLIYDEEKKLKLKIDWTSYFSSALKAAESIIRKFSDIKYLWIYFKSANKDNIEKAINELNSAEDFTSRQSSLNTIEFFFTDCSHINERNKNIFEIYNWKFLNKIKGPADRRILVKINNWNLEYLSYLKDVITWSSNYIEFYFLDWKLDFASFYNQNKYEDSEYENLKNLVMNIQVIVVYIKKLLCKNVPRHFIKFFIKNIRILIFKQ